MAEQNQDLFGKKIFFLNPNYTFKTQVISELRMLEYEVYIIDNYRDAKNILRKNPNSICFVNIDSQLSTYGWYIFFTEFEKDEQLKGTVLGIISDRLTPIEKTFFLDKINPKAGVMEASTDSKKIVENIEDILKINNAKGRRQYVRANCLSDKNSMLIFNDGNLINQLKLVDISHMSAATLAPAIRNTNLEKNTLIRGATLKLGSKQYIINFIVYDIHTRGDKELLITLFTPETVSGLKEPIMDYVFETLQTHLAASINGERRDETNYNQQGKAYAEAMKKEAAQQKKENEAKSKSK